MAVQQDAVLDKPLHRARQHHAFDIAANRSQGIRVHRMIDPLDALLDDRPLVEVAGDEMRRRADQLDAAVMRLVIRLGALEAGQEGMVDIDCPAAQGFAHFRRENLHVARQHHQVDIVGLDDFHHALFLDALGLGRGARRQRQMMERNVVTRRQLVEIRMVGNDGRDFHRQQAALVAEQQVIEAVADFRHHQHHARLLFRVMQLPVQPHAIGHGGKLRAQQRIRPRRVFRGKVHAHEKQLGLGIAELRRIDDVAAMFGQEAGNAMNDTALVKTGQGKNVFRMHRGHGKSELLCRGCVTLLLSHG